MLALHHGFAAFDSHTGHLAAWSDPEAHLPRNRFNDGKCDPAGRFWAGTISFHREPGAARLYCLEPDGGVRAMLRGLTWFLVFAFSPVHSHDPGVFRSAAPFHRVNRGC